MRVSELVAELEGHLSKFGDVDVMLWLDDAVADDLDDGYPTAYDVCGAAAVDSAVVGGVPYRFDDDAAAWLMDPDHGDYDSGEEYDAELERAKGRLGDVERRRVAWLRIERAVGDE